MTEEIVKPSPSGPIRFRELSWAPDYWIGEDGSVYSTRRCVWKSNDGPVWRQLTSYRRPYGSMYFVVCIRPQPGGRVVQKYVHRLVLELFVGLAPNGLVACHNDGDTANNSLSNLRWDTSSANVADQKRHGTFVGYYTVIDGERRIVSDVARERGIKPKTINSRLARGWDLERAISEPIQKSGRWHSGA